jgi:REP element-mobilizing transposase RayT
MIDYSEDMSVEQHCFHIIFALKNSRYEYSVIDHKNEAGFVARTFPFYDGVEEDNLIGVLCEVAMQLQLKVLAFNFCGDHVHAVIEVHDHELTTKIGLWKGKSAYEFNRRMSPSVDSLQPVKADGTKSALWARSFYRKYVNSQEQLNSTMIYLKNNRLKHRLPPLSPSSQSMIERLVSQK